MTRNNPRQQDTFDVLDLFEKHIDGHDFNFESSSITGLYSICIDHDRVYRLYVKST